MPVAATAEESYARLRAKASSKIGRSLRHERLSQTEYGGTSRLNFEKVE
jgi:hypothetical protein